MAKILIGTSGWSYKHWDDVFYPPKIESHLHFFAEHYPTVEINTTFYHLPRDTAVKNWFAQVPEDFVFAVKANGYITHRKRLKDCENSVPLFFKTIRALKDKRGPILFQLPPSLKMDLERFKSFLKLIVKRKGRFTFEFRHESWFCEEIYDLLRKNNITLTFTDLYGKMSPQIITGDFVYLRLHGPKKSYTGSYSSAQLRKWKKQFTEYKEKGLDVFCYFDNDEKGYAIKDSARLAKMLSSE